MADGNDAPIIAGIEGLVEIGRGGFAIVYRGHQTAFRRDVAVKVLTRSGLDADDRRRFERECQAMGLLSDHPGIVTLYDAGFTSGGRPYMVMAHVGGGSLSDHLAVDGPMGWQDVTRLGVRLCGALETAHRAAVLHRDIKPANILRSDYGEQLSDFGIARIAGGHETRSGVITASLAHAAPEILDGSRPTVQADVYSLGSTLYEAAMGQAAFVRDTDESLLPLIRRVVTEPVPQMEPAGIPAPLARVIEVSMAKNPDDRYASAEAFGLALRGAQAVLGIPVSELMIVGGVSDTTIVNTSDGALGAITGELTGTPRRHAQQETTTAEPGEDDTPDAAGPPDQDTPEPAPPRSRTPEPTTTPPAPPPTDPPDDGPPAGRSTPPPPPPTDPSSTEPPTTTGGPPGPPPGAGGLGGPPGAPPPPPGGATRTEGSGSRGALIFAVLGIVAAVGAAVVFFATRGGDDTAAPDALNTTTSASETTDAPATSDPTGTTITPLDDPIPAVVVLAEQFGGQLAPTVATTLESLEATAGISAETVITTPGQLRAVLGTRAELGNDPVVVFGPANAVDVGEAAADHRDTTFVLIGGEALAPNVISLTYADNEVAYVTGVAAARATTTRRVAFIGRIDDVATRVNEAGFVAGVRSVDPGIVIDVRYLGTPQSTAADARQLTNLVIANGADVIYHVAGQAGFGVLDAASEIGGVWTIGSTFDWYVAAPPEQQPFVLSSTLQNHGVVLEFVLTNAQQGMLDDLAAAPALGIADGAVDFSISGGFLDEIVNELLSVGATIANAGIPVPDVVGERALAPVAANCPPEGCQVRILDAFLDVDELVVTIEANWFMDVNGIHAHYFWSPTYSAEQVGGDSQARFGVPVGSWDLDDRFPFYRTENAVSLAARGPATELCVTAADPGHNVIDPTLVWCIDVTDRI